MKKGFLNQNLEDGLGDERSEYSLKIDKLRKSDGFALGSGWDKFDPSKYKRGTGRFTKPKIFKQDTPKYHPSFENPKNALSLWYGQRYKDQKFQMNECFVTWPDENSPSHAKTFTSVFKCPITLEKFMSGKWKNPKRFSTTMEKSDDPGASVEVIWFSKKKDAEHAAAANALDCLSFREDGKCYNLCEDAPYRENDRSLVLPSSAPRDEIFSDVVMTEAVANVTEDEDMEDDLQFRNDYRAMRKSA